ncbi:hypothetical protein [Actinoplanes solisilvae]|uniref:hypothetical protein n=1 Tax=Actinoplanes solisilvae TaxID=2486853 RepID=UPI000FD83696|nr:hypothetical protein [Actinoplanes solisilvae]
MSWNRRTTHRLAAIDAYRFPATVRQRFATEHDTLTATDLDAIESAARQWFRLAARHPRARTAMPSQVTDALRRALSQQTADYAAFCTEAFGRPYLPPPVTAHPSAGLAETLRLARQDENCGPGALPLLFRVDQQLAIPGGHRYLADCGGRGVCHDLPGTLCLMHLTGTGRLVRNRGRKETPPPTSPDAAGFGGGGGP